MLKPNVVGVAIGQKFTGGISKGELSILTLVKKKEKNLPERATVPVTIEGVKTDIVEVGEIIQHLPEIQLVILMLGVFAHSPKRDIRQNTPN
ncbi:hypothetical protein ABD81_18810 [Bacillus thuringiensis]|uniref:hypothetical protein n=1 Tax=Bacillus thuringiensis TaxID=1428 RepID=UPI000A39CE1C|nr:hypothetical protein [Bacillus thuringiensis]MBG9750798.1 hypothetical protein [Bacillus thuringiensis]MBG9779784.1 hypothetical protein [Bacillus thuringiensis]MBG9929278.1 hypothetical protein [Bacillus thuringiensis]OTZ84575.1 hypothetical protein BK771_20445 [Bacillus thuringiensis serovar ostriniae]